MISPNMTEEKYKKMPMIAKAIYWLSVSALAIAFAYFWFGKEGFI